MRQGNSITLGGIELDNPLSSPDLYSGKVSVEKDGARTSVSSVWLERYAKDANGATCLESHLLEMTNRGSCSLDGQPLKDASAVSLVKEIFAELSKPS